MNTPLLDAIRKEAGLRDVFRGIRRGWKRWRAWDNTIPEPKSSWFWGEIDPVTKRLVKGTGLLGKADPTIDRIVDKFMASKWNKYG